jgi:hypothetical protein
MWLGYNKPMNNVNREFLRWMPIIVAFCWATWNLRGLYDQLTNEWRPTGLRELHPEKDRKYLILARLISPAKRQSLDD